MDLDLGLTTEDKFKLYYWCVRSDSKHVFLHLTQQLDNLYPDQPGCTAVYQIINPGNNTPERNINGWGQLFSSFMTPDTCRVKKMMIVTWMFWMFE